MSLQSMKMYIENDKIRNQIGYDEHQETKNGICRGIPYFLIFDPNIDCRYSLERLSYVF